MNIIKENTLLNAEVSSMLDKSRDLLSLGSKSSFRQISGIDIVTNIESAMLLLKEVSQDMNLDNDEADIETLKARHIQLAEEYLMKARHSILEMKDYVEALRNGASLANTVVSELFAISNKL